MLFRFCTCEDLAVKDPSEHNRRPISLPGVMFGGFANSPQGASKHIAALMQEREDYEEAIRAQALRIQQLEADLAASNEQVELQTLIGCVHRQ